MTIQDVFAENVRRLRSQAGLSQEALAELAGLHRTYIGCIEQGGANVTLKNVERIACALGVAPDRLLAPCIGASPQEGDAATS